MTLITAFADSSGAHMMGDRRSLQENRIFTLAEAKIARRHNKKCEMLIGAAGLLVTSGCIREAELPLPEQGLSLAWARSVWVPALRALLSANDLLQTSENFAPRLKSDSDFVLAGIGARGAPVIIGVDEDFAVYEPTTPFYCIGSGAPYARALLQSRHTAHLEPEKRLSHAAEIASNFDSGVGPPFDYIRIPA